VGKSEVYLRNLQKVSWWRGAKVSQGDVNATGGQLVQGPVGLVKFGVFNLTAMARYCRILDRGYGIISVVFKKISLASVQLHWKHLTFYNLLISYITTALASFTCGLIFALCVFPTLQEPPKGFFGKNCKRKCNNTNNGRCHRTVPRGSMELAALQNVSVWRGEHPGMQCQKWQLHLQIWLPRQQMSESLCC